MPELTPEQFELHFRVGTALGLPADRPRPKPPWIVNYPALTDLEPCELCGTKVVALLGAKGPKVCEVKTDTFRKKPGKWSADTVLHRCRGRRGATP